VNFLMDEGSDRVQATYPRLWEVARRLLRIDRDGGYAVDAEEWLTPPTTWGVWRRMAAGSCDSRATQWTWFRLAP
jgi:hypothetical protein